MEGLREQGDKYNEDATTEREAIERADIEGDMVSEAKGGIIGAIAEVIKRKLTMPNEEDVSDEGEKKVMANVEETPPGRVADTLKTTDLITGQTFNAMRKLGEEDTWPDQPIIIKHE